MKINVNELDFSLIKENLKNYLRTSTEFTEFDYDGSTLNAILDILAYNTHYTGLYQNLTINEMFLDSASKRNSIVSLAKGQGYIPRSCIAPRAKVRVEGSNVDNPPFLILPKYTKFTASTDTEQYNFLTLQNYYAQNTAGGYTFDDVEIIEGNYVTEVFEIQDGQRYILSNPEIDTTTMIVYLQENLTNTNVRYFNNANTLIGLDPKTDTYFIKELDDNIYEIQFGDGILGFKPDVGNILTVSYVVPSKPIVNGVRIFNMTNLSDIQSPTIITLTPSNGGREKEDIESIRFNTPRYKATQGSATTVENYKAIILSKFSQVKNVTIWGGEDNIPPVYGKVFICPNPVQGDTFSSVELEDIKNELLKKYSVVTIIPEMVNPEKLNIILDITAYYDGTKTNSNASSISSVIYDAVSTYTATNLDNFDSVFRFSKFQNLVDKSHTAITNSTISVKLIKNIIVKYNSNALYTINLINPIYNDSKGGNVVSTGFYIKNYTDLCYFEDDGAGLIRLIKFDSNNNKIIINANIGTIVYDTGSISIKNLNITQVVNDSLNMLIYPSSNDVVSALNYIIDIDLNNITINSIDDSTVNGNTKGGKNYIFAPFRG